jgi:carbamoyl-phosphate synthase large subunit
VRILPSYKIVDTCAAEFKAQTPYFYASFDKQCDSRSFPKSGKQTVIVIGSGPIRIGQGIEFDYSSVHCVRSLKDMGYDVIIINNNPETVSTDYDTADRLYFEPLTPEDVMGVIEAEKPIGVVVAFGGQTAIKLTSFLDKKRIKILGTSAEGIDVAEDRKNSTRCLSLWYNPPRGMAFIHGGIIAAEIWATLCCCGPLCHRGQNMVIANDRSDLERYIDTNPRIRGEEYSVLVDKYMPERSLSRCHIRWQEMCLFPYNGAYRAGGNTQRRLNCVYPPFSLTDKMIQTVVDCSEKLASCLGTRGLVNIQYLIYSSQLYVIEVNPRASEPYPI